MCVCVCVWRDADSIWSPPPSLSPPPSPPPPISIDSAHTIFLPLPLPSSPSLLSCPKAPFCSCEKTERKAKKRLLLFLSPPLPRRGEEMNAFAVDLAERMKKRFFLTPAEISGLPPQGREKAKKSTKRLFSLLFFFPTTSTTTGFPTVRVARGSARAQSSPAASFRRPQWTGAAAIRAAPQNLWWDPLAGSSATGAAALLKVSW